MPPMRIVRLRADEPDHMSTSTDGLRAPRCAGWLRD
ncbi:hypothetical protein GZL_09022 [Streptomyces sp. 769]|nr:hypothetical protein GZL_09022 [Streptomyces sp. 769]